MANKWMRKLGIGMSVMMTVSQLSGVSVLAAPEEEFEPEETDIELLFEAEDEMDRVEEGENTVIPPTEVWWEGPGLLAFRLGTDQPLHYSLRVYRDNKEVGATGLPAVLDQEDGVARFNASDYFEGSGTYTAKIFVHSDSAPEDICSTSIPEIYWTQPEQRVATPENLRWEYRDSEHFAVVACDSVEHALRYDFIWHKGNIGGSMGSWETEQDFSNIVKTYSGEGMTLSVQVISNDLSKYANSLESYPYVPYSPQGTGENENNNDNSNENENENENTTEGAWQNDYEYTLSGAFLVIRGYNGTSTELTIPSKAVIDGVEYFVEVDSLESAPGAAARDSITKIAFEKGVYFGGYMSFENMNSLSELDLAGVDTSAMRSMDNMFRGCASLKKLDLSSFNTSNVKGYGDPWHVIGGMDYMFEGCSSLTELDLSTFDTTNVYAMRSMFADCTSLQSVNLESFSTEHVCEVGGMFKNCRNLTTLDLSNFDLKCTFNNYLTGKGRIMSSGAVGMFKDSGIITLKTPRNIIDTYEHIDTEWNINEVTIGGPNAGLPGEFVDQITGKVYTDLPCGEDGTVSHTLVRKDSSSDVDIDDNGKSNTFSKEEAISGVSVIDDDHTLQLETDANGLFVGAKILKADGTVDTGVNSYIANIVTKYAADGTPEEFYSLVFRNGVWDTSYDTVKDGLYTYLGEQYSIAGGTVNLDVNGLTYTGDIDGWKYIVLGHLVKNHGGLVSYGPVEDLHWFWIDDNGSCDRDYAAIVNWSGADFLVHGGMLRTDFTGFTYDPQNKDKWYHITNGQVWGDGEITDMTIEGDTITRTCSIGAVLD